VERQKVEKEKTGPKV